MVVRTWMCGAAAMVLACGAATGAGVGPQQNSGSTSGLPLSAQEMFNSISGEFEGTVQKLGADGKLHKAPASSSNKTESNGRRLVSVFECVVNGEMVDGAVVWSVPQSGSARSTWSYDATPFAATGKVMAREMTFTGQPATGGTPVKIEQTVSVLNFNSYQITWNRIESNGTKTLVMHLDMRRMGEGKSSSAANRASSSRAVAMAKSAMDDVQRTAGVSE